MRVLTASPYLGAASLLIVSPAAAQFVGRPVYEPVPVASPYLGDSSLPGPGIGRELRNVRRGIERARETGELTRREARQLYREARLIDRAAERYGQGGLSALERRELETRARVLRESLARARTGKSRAGGKG
ncbi:MAG TPA: hypothetical protein VF631_01695 [Allosphingosinicella sp.]|jgi:hypothetical protein|uniref:hypothetical protein n=1 Tax=Allosphingosinicella sp. TaxID=2823234 RepID=UPI002F2A9B79